MNLSYSCSNVLSGTRIFVTQITGNVIVPSIVEQRCIASAYLRRNRSSAIKNSAGVDILLLFVSIMFSLFFSAAMILK